MRKARRRLRVAITKADKNFENLCAGSYYMVNDRLLVEQHPDWPHACDTRWRTLTGGLWGNVLEDDCRILNPVWRLWYAIDRAWQKWRPGAGSVAAATKPG